MSGIGSTRRQHGRRDGIDPGPRTAADAYRVSDDQLHRARLVVARNSEDSEDLRQLLDMLGPDLVEPGPAAAGDAADLRTEPAADPGCRCGAAGCPMLCWLPTDSRCGRGRPPVVQAPIV